MPLNIITAENIRTPLKGLIDSVIQKHIAHRLADDFLILTPDSTASQDIIEHFLSDPRLGGVLTGSSIVSLDRWVQMTAQDLAPSCRVAPPWLLEALFKPLAEKIAGGVKSGQARALSIPSLFQLVTTFRDELKDAQALRSFVAAFDPELAADCVTLSQNYRDAIDRHPHTKDIAWQIFRTLEGIEKHQIPSLKKLKTLYWLGFTHPFPLLQKMMDTFLQSLPTLEQVLLLQIPKGADPQDIISTSWGENRSVFPFTGSSAQKPLVSLLEFTGPFDEAGFILSEIHQRVTEGADPGSMTVILPPDPFWESYFSSQLEKLGLVSSALHRKPLASFAGVSQTSFLKVPEALAQVENAFRRLEKEFLRPASSDENWNKGEMALELRALHQWKEILEDVLFYETELPEIGDSPFYLPKIAATTFLKERSFSGRGIALRPHTSVGLKSFEEAFAFQLTDRFIPHGPERFFGSPLPQSHRSPQAERALFQKLLGVAQGRLTLSYSTHSPQGEEGSPSPYLTEFGFLQPQVKRHFPVFVTGRSPVDLEKRILIERTRERDLEYRNPYGGLIQDSKLLALLKEKIATHVYSPSQLENYVSCPFKFFASTLLGLKAPLEKTPDGSAADRGHWLHRFLEFYFSTYREKMTQAGRDISLQAELLGQIPHAFEAFSESYLKEKPWIHETLSKDFMSRASSAVQGLLKNFWWTFKMTERPFLPSYFEKPFGMEGEEPLLVKQEGGDPLKIRGRIDRMDLTEDGREFIVFDYKTGDTAEISKNIKKFKSLQLPIYLLAAKQILSSPHPSPSRSTLVSGAGRGHPPSKLPPPAGRRAGAGKLPEGEGIRKKSIEPRGALAISLKEMKINEGLLKKEEKKRLSFKGRTALWEEGEWEDYWKKLEETLLKINRTIAAGDFRVTPDPCDPYCDFRTICRYHERAKTNT